MKRNRWFRNATAIALLTFLSIGLTAAVMLIYRARSNTELAGYATAKALSEQMVIFREVYAREVLARAGELDIPIDDGRRNTSHGLPLPVTMVRHMGASMARHLPGSEIRILSRYPFYGDHPLDAFEVEALAALEAHPEQPFYRLEEHPAGEVMRYAVAERMTAECVSCHNNHPASPKRDWQVGDTRGMVEIVVPVGVLANQFHRRELMVTVAILLGAGLLFGLVLLVLRHDFHRLQREDWALTDELTGLATRRTGMETLSREVDRARRHNLPLCFVMFDLDHFKLTNDRHGHSAGDALLRDFGAILRSSARANDHVIRWGGEEFLVVLPHTTMDQAAAFADRIRRTLADAPRPIRATVSAGVAELAAGEAVDLTIVRADRNLYRAKQAGRNRVCADPPGPAPALGLAAP